MFFDSWSSLFRIVAVGVPAYLALLILLRIGGKRTLSKFNAYDFVITVAFGSTLSAGLVSQERPLADVVLAFALLVALQYAVTATMVRWPRTEKLFKAEPRLVFHNAEFLHDAMRRERLTEREVAAALRSAGFGASEDVSSVVFETDGSFSIIGKMNGSSAMIGVDGRELLL